MPSINFYFQVHQPYRIKKYTFFDINHDHDYFDLNNTDGANSKILKKVAYNCYLPTNKLLLEVIKKHPEVRFSFSLSGVFLEQSREFMPEIIDSFKALVDTGKVEILSETYYHSLSFLYSKDEFRQQVKKHSDLIMELFEVKPKVFRNTELIYANELAVEIEKMGYKGILAEGVDRILDWRSSNFLYKPKGTKKLKLFLKNYRLSDDIAFRFSNKTWPGYPLTTTKFASWVKNINGNGEIVNLFMDYETFGEHQWSSTGIFEFMKHLPSAVLGQNDIDFITPSMAIDRYQTHGEMDIHDYISWADSERDLSAWRSNSMQFDALTKIYDLERLVKSTGNKILIEDWRKLQTSDHFYYMCTKFWSDGDVHKYFSPYNSPYEAFIFFVNALHDLTARIMTSVNNKLKPKRLLLSKVNNSN